MTKKPIIGVADNLVSSLYLHSDPNNFMYFSNFNISANPSDNIINKLESLRGRAITLEKAFYEDFDTPEHPIKNADDFSRTYLLFEYNSKNPNNTEQQKILHAMLQRNVVDILISFQENVTLEALNAFITKGEFKEILEDIGEIAIQDMGKAIIEVINRGIKYNGEIIKSMARQPIRLLSSEKSGYIPYFKKALNESYKGEGSQDKIIDGVLNQFRENYNTANNKYPDNIIIEKIRENLKKANQDIFRSYSSAIGVVLEASFIYDPHNLIKGIIPSEGALGAEGGKKDTGFKGKSGQTYNIQLKNTFYDTRYYSIKSGSDQLLHNFLLDLAKDNQIINRKDIPLIEYTFINTEFLKRHGLTRGKKTDTSKLLGEQKAKMYDFLSKLLSYAVVEFIGQRISKEQADNISAGNLFFIYKGVRLIPISFFLTIVINFLRGDIQNENKGFKLARGEKTSSSIKEGVYPNAEDFYQKKKDALDKLRKPGNPKNLMGYRYPSELVKIGHEAGEKVKDSIKIGERHFLLAIGQLDDYLKHSI